MHQSQSKAEPASLDDVPALVDIFFDSFNDDFFTKLFPPTEEVRTFIGQAYADFIKSEPGRQESKMYVVRDSSSKAVSSALLWIIRAGDSGLHTWQKRWPEPGPSMSPAALDAFFNAMSQQHHEAMGDQDHMFLEIIATMASQRKRGHGTVLLQLINQIADESDYPFYLDAARDAKALYERVGYEVNGHVEATSPFASMTRKKKSERAGEGETN